MWTAFIHRSSFQKHLQRDGYVLLLQHVQHSSCKRFWYDNDTSLVWYRVHQANIRSQDAKADIRREGVQRLWHQFCFCCDVSTWSFNKLMCLNYVFTCALKNKLSNKTRNTLQSFQSTRSDAILPSTNLFTLLVICVTIAKATSPRGSWAKSKQPRDATGSHALLMAAQTGVDSL